MSNVVRALPAILLIALLMALCPSEAAAHAALERSEPAAGEVLPEPPTVVSLWFTEPLEQAFTGADLLDASGEAVPGIAVAISPEDDHALEMTLPPGLVEGAYTVAWRTLSSADGHTAEGYFGFRVGEGAAAGAAAQGTASASQRPRELTRGLALIGLAALLAIAPITLAVLDPATRRAPALARTLPRYLRRYAVFAIVLALLGSVAALGAQAASIAPGEALLSAMGQTLSDTRYGQLWLVRIALLVVGGVLVAAALWGREGWRRGLLLLALLVSVAMPIPFSLLSHAAALAEGRDTAIAADVLHLLLASIWAGGLFMLVLVLLPAVWRLATEERGAALWAAIPRFSAIGLTAWGILVLSGLYSAWLQVGALEALRETAYGQALLLKGALLLPVLALAAVHLLLGRRGVGAADAPRVRRTFILEAAIVVVVLLVVGRLIGLEPAREAIAVKAPASLDVQFTFDTNEGPREGLLAISPGAAGVNTFTLEVSGADLPEGSEGVLRFALPGRDIGEQELRLPAEGANRFSAQGDELALSGDWRVSTLVRKIGAFSWASEAVIPVGAQPPRPPEVNPAPRFGEAGVIAMVVMALGIAALATALVARAPRPRRGAVAAAGAIAAIGGGLVLSGATLPPATTAAEPLIAAAPEATEQAPATPADMAAHHDAAHAHHATPRVEAAAMAGTPVARDGLVVTIAADPVRPGPADVTIAISDDDGEPVSGARVVVFSEMTAMDMDREQTIADETDAGRYQAAGVPLEMTGEWRLSVRISPKGQPSLTVPFVVNVR